MKYIYKPTKKIWFFHSLLIKLSNIENYTFWRSGQLNENTNFIGSQLCNRTFWQNAKLHLIIDLSPIALIFNIYITRNSSALCQWILKIDTGYNILVKKLLETNHVLVTIWKPRVVEPVKKSITLVWPIWIQLPSWHISWWSSYWWYVPVVSMLFYSADYSWEHLKTTLSKIRRSS